MTDNPLLRRRAPGLPALSSWNGRGEWALTFGSEGGLGPSGGNGASQPIRQATEEEAIQASLLDEQLAMDHRRAVERGTENQAEGFSSSPSDARRSQFVVSEVTSYPTMSPFSPVWVQE